MTNIFGTATHSKPIYVPGVSVYGKFPMKQLSIAEAFYFVRDHEPEVVLILGAYDPACGGRQSLTLDDLDRWTDEDHTHAMEKAIDDGELAAEQMGILR